VTRQIDKIIEEVKMSSRLSDSILQDAREKTAFLEELRADLAFAKANNKNATVIALKEEIARTQATINNLEMRFLHYKTAISSRVSLKCPCCKAKLIKSDASA
jgi:prophage tail gpP-like protein